jgi:hypothetical protein
MTWLRTRRPGFDIPDENRQLFPRQSQNSRQTSTAEAKNVSLFMRTLIPFRQAKAPADIIKDAAGFLKNKLVFFFPSSYAMLSSQATPRALPQLIFPSSLLLCLLSLVPPRPSHYSCTIVELILITISFKFSFSATCFAFS